MLEPKDLEAIALLLDEKLEKNNVSMKTYINERFEEYDKRMDKRFEENNASMKEYMDGQFKENNASMKEYMDRKLKENNISMKAFIGDEIAKSESFLLEEMERMNKSTDAKIEYLQKKIDDLTQYYRITKLENDNTTLLLQLVSRLQEDVEELKKKIA